MCSQCLLCMKQLVVSVCQRAAYPCCLAWGRGKVGETGFSKAEEKFRKLAKVSDVKYSSPSLADSLNLSLCPILAKILRQGRWLRLKGGREGARPPWVASRVWQSGKWGGGGQAPTGGQGQTGWRWGLAAGHGTGECSADGPVELSRCQLVGMKQIWAVGPSSGLSQLLHYLPFCGVAGTLCTTRK